jgi:hypothetical protein
MCSVISTKQRVCVPFAACREKFRCCTPADEPDTCAHNGSDSYYHQARQERRDHEFMGMLGDDHAALCSWIPTEEDCPPFALTGPADVPSCRVFEMNW